jgi:hypothetical protein
MMFPGPALVCLTHSHILKLQSHLCLRLNAYASLVPYVWADHVADVRMLWGGVSGVVGAGGTHSPA